MWQFSARRQTCFVHAAFAFYLKKPAIFVFYLKIGLLLIGVTDIRVLDIRVLGYLQN